MTTIATDGRTMAGDGNSTIDGGIVRTAYPKVQRLSDGRLFGACGEGAEGTAIFTWLEAGANRNDYPAIKDPGTMAIVLGPDGTVLAYDQFSAGFGDLLDVPIAIGSGQRYAIGAMDAGASPLDAIRITARRDPYTGGTITHLTITEGD